MTGGFTDGLPVGQQLYDDDCMIYSLPLLAVEWTSSTFVRRVEAMEPLGQQEYYASFKAYSTAALSTDSLIRVCCRVLKSGLHVSTLSTIDTYSRITVYSRYSSRI
jgi:hypothetical protein